MSDLPQGTVTFAFTDIEGSTALLKQLTDGYGEVLAAHRRLVRDAFTAHGGVEIDTQGDAFFFAFVRARDAVAAAAKVQRSHVAHSWPPGAEVRMRVGLHTGEPTVGEEGYLGLDVVRAARLCGACRGGQVLLSETTRSLVGTTLPPGVSVFPLGERHLKDIDQPEHIFELDIEGVKPSPLPDADNPSESAMVSDSQWEEDFERRVEDVARRSAEGVLGMVKRSFGKFGRSTLPGQVEERDAGQVDDIATRADELAKRIGLEIHRALYDSPDADDR